jgi:hypothetical protein
MRALGDVFTPLGFYTSSFWHLVSKATDFLSLKRFNWNKSLEWAKKMRSKDLSKKLFSAK